MARRRASPLPRGITERKRARGVVYLLSFADQHGELRQELAGADLREAKRLLAQRRAEVAAGTYAPGATGGTTIAAYASTWLDARRKRGVRSVDDEAAHVRLHIVPALGKVRLGDLRPRDVAAWVDAMKAEGTRAAKSILNTHGVLHAMMEAARFEELIVANPASLPRGMLPRKPRGGGERFERTEIEALLTDERIDEHRRVFYALMALGGMRCGEASGRRWRDLDVGTPELHAMRVHTQYDDRPLKTARDDDTAERLVPVHRELARVLAAFRLRTFAPLYGRQAWPEDWIAADPRTRAPRTQAQAQNALRRDCARLGIPPRGTHAFRRAFISLARSDGARADMLERVTHNARGTVLDGYTSPEWTALCEAVSCLRIELRRGTVIELPRAQAAGDGRRELDASLDAPTAPIGIITESAGGGGSRTTGQRGNRRIRVDSGDTPGARDRRVPEGPASERKRLTRVKLKRLARAEKLLRELGHGDKADAVREAIDRLEA